MISRSYYVPSWYQKRNHLVRKITYLIRNSGEISQLIVPRAKIYLGKVLKEQEKIADK